MFTLTTWLATGDLWEAGSSRGGVGLGETLVCEFSYWRALNSKLSDNIKEFSMQYGTPN